MVNTKPGLKDPILHISLSICCQEPGIKVLNSVSQSLYFPLSLDRIATHGREPNFRNFNLFHMQSLVCFVGLNFLQLQTPVPVVLQPKRVAAPRR
jgi:hypothetical protein